MSIVRLLSRFLGSRDGSVAPMMALAALPLFGFVGAAIDFSRAASARTAMQATLDASAHRRALARIAITSSVYGLVRPGERIAPYRLGGGVSLPGLGRKNVTTISLMPK